jgi:hypothetical protein
MVTIFDSFGLIRQIIMRINIFHEHRFYGLNGFLMIFQMYIDTIVSAYGNEFSTHFK